MSSCLLCSVLCSLLPLSVLLAQDHVTITTESGAVKGALSPRSNVVYRFLAIPYANPPSRFRKAELVTPWKGVRDATKFRSSCIQVETPLFTKDRMSEDCLTLDVYTPSQLTNSTSVAADNKAVMVWIHGGGFLSGGSEIFEKLEADLPRLTDGNERDLAFGWVPNFESKIRESPAEPGALGSLLSEWGDVVVVAVQYRMGPFGFLYTQDKRPSNLGLWDQRLALQWVQNNIRAFGGDSRKVTVFGESAGAISISCHMISPEVNSSLFSRAILESGTILNGDKTLKTRDMAVSEIAQEAGCNNMTNLTTDAQLNCLESVDPYALMIAAVKLRVTFWPTSGDAYIPYDSLEILNKYYSSGADGVRNYVGSLASYDLLIGHNGDEGIVMLPFIYPNQNLSNGVSKQQYHSAMQSQTIEPLLTNTTCIDDITNVLISFYNQPVKGIGNRTEMEKNLKHSEELIGDFALKIPPLLLSLIHSDLTAKQPTRKQTFYYEFDHKPELPSPIDAGPSWLKTSANHVDELQFIFSVLPDFTGPSNFSTAELALAHTMVEYWSNFAKFGNTRSECNAARGSTNWKSFSSSERSFMRLTLDKDVSEYRPRGAMVDIWLGILSGILDQRQ